MATRKRLTQKIAFGLFRLLSLGVVVILFAILGFIIVKGIGVIETFAQCTDHLGEPVRPNSVRC